MRAAVFLCALLRLATADLAISLPPVLGIDLGNEYTKVAAMAPNFPRDMILNSQSQRRSRTCVDFSGPVRTFGEAAFSQQAMRPEAVIQYSPSSIGMSSSLLSKISTHLNGFPHKYYPYKAKERHSSKTIALELGGSQNLSLTYEDILVNLLAEIKEMTRRYLKNTVSRDFESAFVVPVGYTYRQRQLLNQAAQTAGLNTLAMVPEPLAAALSHSLDLKKDELQQGSSSNNETTAWNKVFISVGARNLQACLIQAHFIDASNITVKKFHTNEDVVVITGKGCVQTAPSNDFQAAGAHMLDVLLADYLTEKAVRAKTLKQKKLTSKDLRKIVRDAGRIKHTLSTNRESTLFLDSLGDGNGLIKESVTREAFEVLIEKSGWLKGINALHDGIERLRAVNNVTGEIQAVELVGGGWRVPRVNAEIAKIFSPAKLSFKCNADESMAMGASIIAANYSSIYKSKPLLFSIPLNEKLSVEIRYVTYEGAEQMEQLTYDADTRLGVSSTRVFNTNSNVKVVVRNAEGRLLDNIAVEGFNQINKTKTDDAKVVEDAKKEYESNNSLHEWSATEDKPAEAVQVSITVRLTPNGLIRVEKATARWQTLTVQKSQITTSSTTSTTTTPAPSSDSTTASTESESTESASDGSTNTTTKTPVVVVGTRFVELVQWRSKTLVINENDMGGLLLDKKKLLPNDVVYPLPLSSKQMREAKALLRSLVKKDQDVEVLNEARNQLESEIYAQRSKLEEDSFVLRVSSAKEREEILASLADDEEWLYNEGARTTLTNVTAKLKELHSRVYNLTMKAAELKNRPQLINKFRNKAKSLDEKVKTLSAKKPWITEEKRANFTLKFDNFTRVFEDLIKNQKSLKDTDEPVMTGTLLETAWGLVQSEFDLLSKIRKPLNFVMPTKDKSNNATGQETEESTSTTKSPKNDSTTTANPEL